MLDLSQRLRRDGYETRLDQYVNGSPVEGWPRWMLDRLDEATHVLVVCTATYYRRFRGQEAPDVGKGVDWEGGAITQELYNSKSRNSRFIPVVFEAEDTEHIPEPLRPFSYYRPTDDDAYGQLLDAIEGTAGIEPAPVGERKPRTRKTSGSGLHPTPL